MTFPLCVLGRLSTKAISRGYAWTDRRPFTKPAISRARAESPLTPCAGTTKAFTTCPRRASGTPMTAASATAGWAPRALSTSNGPIR